MPSACTAAHPIAGVSIGTFVADPLRTVVLSARKLRQLAAPAPIHCAFHSVSRETLVSAGGSADVVPKASQSRVECCYRRPAAMLVGDTDRKHQYSKPADNEAKMIHVLLSSMFHVKHDGHRKARCLELGALAPRMLHTSSLLSCPLLNSESPLRFT